MARSSVSMKSGALKPEKFSTNSTTVTTTDFFCIKPVFITEMVPGQSINIDCRSFARAEPLQKPLYGSAKLYHRFFFVPNRTIMPVWQDFIDHKSVYNDGVRYTPFVPTITNKELVHCFFRTDVSDFAGFPNTALIQSVSYPTSTSEYDFFLATQVEITEESEVPEALGFYYKFTTRGKRFYDILVSLGYSLNFSYSDETPLSILPLLAYCRIFYDFYRNTSFDVSSLQSALEDWFSRSSLVGVTAPYVVLTAAKVKPLLDCVWRVFYEQDYFTSNQVNPVAGNDTNLNLIDDPSHVGSDVVTTAGSGSTLGNDTPFLDTDGGTLTQYGLDILKGFTDFVKRYALAGWKDADRYLARFGITLSSTKLNQSEYLGRQVLDLQISDVMSNADTAGDNGGVLLGDYAGKGVFVGDSGKVSYSTDEFGYLICVQSCVPMTGYVQGRPRYLQHILPFDFFAGEFDRAGMQATRFDELFADAKTKEQVGFTFDNPDVAPNKVFGYLPRYAEYKVGRDILSGDFLCNTKNAQLDGYHFFRLFDFSSDSDASLSQISSAFCIGDQSQFDRVFSDNTGSSDGFTCVLRFIVTSYAPYSQLFENYDFDGFKQVQMDLQGRHVQ